MDLIYLQTLISLSVCEHKFLESRDYALVLFLLRLEQSFNSKVTSLMQVQTNRGWSGGILFSNSRDCIHGFQN